MAMLRSTLLTLAFVCSAFIGFAQKGYAPFKYDADELTLSLNIKESPWAKKIAPVMQKHHRNPEEASEWTGMFDIILGMQVTDLVMNGHVTVSEEDNIVKIVAEDKEEIATLMAAVKPVLASPEKLDVFLADFDRTSDKGAKK